MNSFADKYITRGQSHRPITLDFRGINEIEAREKINEALARAQGWKNANPGTPWYDARTVIWVDENEGYQCEHIPDYAGSADEVLRLLEHWSSGHGWDGDTYVITIAALPKHNRDSIQWIGIHKSFAIAACQALLKAARIEVLL